MGAGVETHAWYWGYRVVRMRAFWNGDSCAGKWSGLMKPRWAAYEEELGPQVALPVLLESDHIGSGYNCL